MSKRKGAYLAIYCAKTVWKSTFERFRNFNIPFEQSFNRRVNVQFWGQIKTFKTNCNEVNILSVSEYFPSYFELSFKICQKLRKTKHTVITRKLWTRKSTFELKIWLKIVKWTWGTWHLNWAVQCKQTHFT